MLKSAVGTGCTYGGLGFVGIVKTPEMVDYPNPSPPNLKLCRFGGSGFAELEFWFWALWVPGRMGAAGLKLQLSTRAVWLR